MKTIEEDMFLAADTLTKEERRYVLEAFTRIQDAFQDVPAEQPEEGENLMKLYIAGPYAAREQLQVVADQIAATGKHTIGASWLYGSKPIGPGTLGASLDETDDTVSKAVAQDLQEVDDADMLVHFTESAVLALDPTLTNLATGGRHVETGYKLALNNGYVVIVGAPENIFQRALAIVVPDLAALMRFLNDQE